MFQTNKEMLYQGKMQFSDLKPMIFEWNNAKAFPSNCNSKTEKVTYMTMKALSFYGLCNWVMDFDNAKRRAGYCSYMERKISLSKHFVELNTFEEIENTIKHEIAHAISFVYFRATGHGTVWKRVAIAIGDDGERCYDSKKVAMPKGKFVYECMGCKKEVCYHKKPKRTKACGECCRKHNFGRFSYDFLLVAKPTL